MPKGGIIRKTNVSQRVSKFSTLTTKFIKGLGSKVKKMHLPGGPLERIQWEDPNDETLARLRHMLSWEIKEGMLNRKDREEEIVVLAVIVWFARMEKQQRDKILTWG